MISTWWKWNVPIGNYSHISSSVNAKLKIIGNWLFHVGVARPWLVREQWEACGLPTLEVYTATAAAGVQQETTFGSRGPASALASLLTAGLHPLTRLRWRLLPSCMLSNSGMPGKTAWSPPWGCGAGRGRLSAPSERTQEQPRGSSGRHTQGSRRSDSVGPSSPGPQGRRARVPHSVASPDNVTCPSGSASSCFHSWREQACRRIVGQAGERSGGKG